jgi:hypothetical protein
MHPGQLSRLVENTLYHYDASWYYKQLADEVDMGPPPVEQPTMDSRGKVKIRTGPNGNGAATHSNGANGNGASKDHAEARDDGEEVPPLTPDEIAELQAMSDVHLEAAVMLDEVVLEVATGVPGGDDIISGLAIQKAERQARIERDMPKRGQRSVLLDRASTPRGRH